MRRSSASTRNPFSRLVARVKHWATRGKDAARRHKISERVETAKDRYESAQDVVSSDQAQGIFERVQEGGLEQADLAGGWGRVTSALSNLRFPTSLSDLGSMGESLVPSVLGKAVGKARSRWTVLAIGWAAFAGWVQAGGLGEGDAKQTLEELSNPTSQVASELEGVISPVRDAVEGLAQRLGAGELDRNDLPQTLEAAGEGLDGLVDLTVAYQPYASPTGNRLDAPSYRPEAGGIVQQEQVEDYTQTSASVSQAASGRFGSPLARGAGWLIPTSAPDPAEGSPEGKAPEFIAFGSPFMDSSPGVQGLMGGVVSASLKLEPVAGQLDDLIADGKDSGVERAYLLGPDGEILHSSGGPKIPGWLASRFRTVFESSDPTETEIRRFSDQVLSGQQGQFPLEDSAGSVTRLMRFQAPGWVEHTPVAGTDWTLAIVYAPGQDRKQSQVSQMGLGLGAFFGLLLTTAASAGAVFRPRGPEPPPFGSSYAPEELDYPNASGNSSPFAVAGGISTAMDALNKKLLDEMGPLAATARSHSTGTGASTALAQSGAPAAGGPAAPAANADGGAGAGAPAGPPAMPPAALAPFLPNPANLPPPNGLDVAPAVVLAKNDMAMPSLFTNGGNVAGPFMGAPDSGRYNFNNYNQVSGGLPYNGGGGGGYGGGGGGSGVRSGGDTIPRLTQGLPSSDFLKEYQPGTTPPTPPPAVVVVPEPSSALLVMMALMAAVAWRVMRRA